MFLPELLPLSLAGVHGRFVYNPSIPSDPDCFESFYGSPHNFSLPKSPVLKLVPGRIS